MILTFSSEDTLRQLIDNSLDWLMGGNKFTSMNWDDLRYFVSFAASGSLSAAARALNVEHATIARRIAALEADLNLKLLDRRGRKLLLTAGENRLPRSPRRWRSRLARSCGTRAASRPN